MSNLVLKQKIKGKEKVFTLNFIDEFLVRHLKELQKITRIQEGSDIDEVDALVNIFDIAYVDGTVKKENTREFVMDLNIPNMTLLSNFTAKLMGQEDKKK